MPQDSNVSERQAHLADGRVLHFPAGTSDQVMAASVRRVLAQGATTPQAPAPTPGRGSSPVATTTPAAPKPSFSQRLESYEQGTGAGPAVTRLGHGAVSFAATMLDPRVPVIGNTHMVKDGPNKGQVAVDPNSMLGAVLGGL